MKKMLCALLLTGCGAAQNLGSRVEYLLSEEPLASGKAGSCMSESQADYQSLRNLKWAMGTDLQVHLDWPDRKDCHSQDILGPTVCEKVQVELRPVGSAWREHDMSDNPAPRFIINLQSVSDGQGGLKTVVRGQEFDPPLLLETNRASAIWFERARDSRYGDVIAGAISEIRIAPGAWAIVAATLRDASGEHLCGAVPAGVRSSPAGLFSVEPLRDTPYANLPYKITAGSSVGAGSFDVSVGDLAASLRVIVE